MAPSNEQKYPLQARKFRQKSMQILGKWLVAVVAHGNVYWECEQLNKIEQILYKKQI